MKLSRRVAAKMAAFWIAGLGLTACESQGPFEETGEEIDEAVDEVEDEVDEEL